ncbi:hypothetical protein pEaSNUABM10_00111 [Erwinia phage pEa_SNUABM_10]|nr:hypothetical protein pEaSNUABM10_00111 [Erwinia phage pEa_SNUABM_10]
MKVVLVSKLTSRLGQKFHAELTDLHNSLYNDQQARLKDLNGRSGFNEIDDVSEVWSEGQQAAIAVDDEGRAVGFLSFSIQTGRSNMGSKWLWIYNFYVNNDQRGKGVGLLLMNAVRDHGKAKGCGFMQLYVLDNNQQAIAMYQKFGFRTEYRDMVKEI